MWTGYEAECETEFASHYVASTRSSRYIKL